VIKRATMPVRVLDLVSDASATLPQREDTPYGSRREAETTLDMA
jgi:hypothetical protein